MTGGEPQVSGHPRFLPEVLGGGVEEATATTGPGLSPTPGPVASSPVVTHLSPSANLSCLSPPFTLRFLGL